MSRSSQKSVEVNTPIKKQRSILEYTKASSTSIERIDTIVDLTSEGEDIVIKDEKIRLKFEEYVDETVLCPICSANLSIFTIDARSVHVESCLTRVDTIIDPSPSQIETIKVNNNKKRKVKKEESIIDKEKTRYVNSISKPKLEPGQEKVIKPPTTIPTSKAKKTIPILKRMRFPIDNDNKFYEVSVDAFNFSPDDIIDKYFLTHFHSDHYGGISKKWSYERVFKDNTDYDDDSKYRKIIYCTPITSKLLTLYFSIDQRFIQELEIDKRYLIHSFVKDIHVGGYESNDVSPGIYVTPITANHCPGAAIFLFESISLTDKYYRILHCGDFRVNMDILDHPILKPYSINGDLTLDRVYLDTTYMSPKYNFPKQELVCETVADLFHSLIHQDDSSWFGTLKQSRITDFLKASIKTKKKKYLILVGTYVIGKEKLAIAISKRLNCQIYASNINSRENKSAVLRTYEDDYLNSVLSDHDLGSIDNESECMIHLVPMRIVGSISELTNYFNHNHYFESFERCVGLRPTGWSFSSMYTSNNLSLYDNLEEEVPEDGVIDIDPNCNNLSQLMEVMQTCPSFSYLDDILPQVSNSIKKGKPDESLYRIYSVPYSEHSSYRELAYFSIFFNIDKLIPTVNVHSNESIKLMENIFKIWESARKIKLQDKEVGEPIIDDSRLLESFGNLSLNDF
ncbi:beta-lactamase-like protein [Scheffersomyces coipomensis]|uniref:beta-lactamase-like protein n=1 Tax=Scheffersomyces coipomensis TaxID=1788519 RepID=UPI00315C6F24